MSLHRRLNMDLPSSSHLDEEAATKAATEAATKAKRKRSEWLTESHLFGWMEQALQTFSSHFLSRNSSRSHSELSFRLSKCLTALFRDRCTDSRVLMSAASTACSPNTLPIPLIWRRWLLNDSKITCKRVNKIMGELNSTTDQRTYLYMYWHQIYCQKRVIIDSLCK